VQEAFAALDDLQDLESVITSIDERVQLLRDLDGAQAES